MSEIILNLEEEMARIRVMLAETNDLCRQVLAIAPKMEEFRRDVRSLKHEASEVYRRINHLKESLDDAERRVRKMDGQE